MRLIKASKPAVARVFAVVVAVAGLTYGAQDALATPSAASTVAAHAATLRPANAVLGVDWTAYLGGPSHWSYNRADKTITPARVDRLVPKWQFDSGSDFLASPVVAQGAVYIGGPDGYFYKLNETTGAVEAKAFIGYQPGLNLCKGMGVVDTAAVAVDPSDNKETVYVGGPDGYLYALDAASLNVKWKSVVALPKIPGHTYFDWSSPTVSHGKVYIGVSSYCNIPDERGAVFGYNQATGTQFGEFYTVPDGDIGGSVWSSVAVAQGGYVYATVANGPDSDPELGYSESIVKLTPTLSYAGSFHVPAAQVTPDGDFGASPTLFGQFVGACNKNGMYYAVNRSTMKLAWHYRIGVASNDAFQANCLAAAAYNGKNIFMAGPKVWIRGKPYNGSIQERSATTGKLIWETGLPNGVIGSPSMNGAGLLAVSTWEKTTVPDETYLINSADGKIVRTLVKGQDFAQTVFADGWIFTANSNGLYAWALGCSTAINPATPCGTK